MPLDECLIRLSPEGFHEEFEADGVNVGVGGLSMRAPVLPDIGSRIRCAFDAPNGASIDAVGEVVWAHESGAYHGEFGVRFAELDEGDHQQIAMLVREWQQDMDEVAGPAQVRLALDNVASTIVADLAEESETELVVEHGLPFLSIGRRVVNLSGGRSGELRGVELRLRDGVPKLALTIGYGEASAPAPAPVVAGDDEMDTMPDADEVRQPRVVLPSDGGNRAAFTSTDSADEEDDDAVVESTAPLSIAHDVLQHARASVMRAWTLCVAGVRALHVLLSQRIAPAIGDAWVRTWTICRGFVTALRNPSADRPRKRRKQRPGAARGNTKASGRLRRRLALALAGLGLIGGGVYWWTQGRTTAPEAAVEAPASEPVVETAVAAPNEAIAQQVKGLAFGTGEVDNGRTFTLTMNGPVSVFDGVADNGGFSVLVPGALSLSRAGPIAAEHPDVERAMILNRGDHAEFNLQFVPGRSKPYEVRGMGSTIEVTIAN